jgi:hypothetical protein
LNRSSEIAITPSIFYETTQLIITLPSCVNNMITCPKHFKTIHATVIDSHSQHGTKVPASNHGSLGYCFVGCFYSTSRPEWGRHCCPSGAYSCQLLIPSCEGFLRGSIRSHGPSPPGTDFFGARQNRLDKASFADPVLLMLW